MLRPRATSHRRVPFVNPTPASRASAAPVAVPPLVQWSSIPHGIGHLEWNWSPPGVPLLFVVERLPKGRSGDGTYHRAVYDTSGPGRMRELAKGRATSVDDARAKLVDWYGRWMRTRVFANAGGRKKVAPPPDTGTGAFALTMPAASPKKPDAALRQRGFAFPIDMGPIVVAAPSAADYDADAMFAAREARNDALGEYMEAKNTALAVARDTIERTRQEPLAVHLDPNFVAASQRLDAVAQAVQATEARYNELWKGRQLHELPPELRASLDERIRKSRQIRALPNPPRRRRAR